VAGIVFYAVKGVAFEYLIQLLRKFSLQLAKKQHCLSQLLHLVDERFAGEWLLSGRLANSATSRPKETSFASIKVVLFRMGERSDLLPPFAGDVKLQGNIVLVVIMSTSGARLVVVNASSGPSGPYDSRKRRFMRLMRSCMLENSRRGPQRVNRVITQFLLGGAKRKNFRWADLVQGI
jgi:hypothetical protein